MSGCFLTVHPLDLYSVLASITVAVSNSDRTRSLELGILDTNDIGNLSRFKSDPPPRSCSGLETGNQDGPGGTLRGFSYRPETSRATSGSPLTCFCRKRKVYQYIGIRILGHKEPSHDVYPRDWTTQDKIVLSPSLQGRESGSCMSTRKRASLIVIWVACCSQELPGKRLAALGLAGPAPGGFPLAGCPGA